MHPIISVIVPCFNAENYIDDCLKSVVNQRNCNYELIVIDGGSSDGTLEIIDKYRDSIKIVISEPDSGQSDAINKGLKYCSGILFSWLNSDDYYTEGALEKVTRAYKENPNTIISGNTRFFGGVHGSAGVTVRPQNLNFEDVLPLWRRRFSWAQPSTFFPRCPSVEINNNLHLAMDYELLLQMLLKHEATLIDAVISNFRVHELAKTAVLGYQNAIELPSIIAAFELHSRHLKPAEFMKFKSRCKMILAKHFLSRHDFKLAFHSVIDAFDNHLSQPLVMLLEYLISVVPFGRKTTFDAFRVSKT
jgi:glycosyltransferase involved in cell wall biosynthesis